MIWVVDASCVVPYLLGDGTEVEHRVMMDEVHVPGLLDIEVTQSLRGLLRGSRVALDRAQLAREELGDLTARRHPNAPLLRRAWELRDVCTTYDALYVALSEALDATLVTRDAKLAEAVADQISVVVVS